MSQKIKAPTQGDGKGFLWGVIAILVIAAVVGGLFIKTNLDKRAAGNNMPQQDVNFEVSLEDNAAVVAAKNVSKDAKTVEIYEDFSCPHCAELAEADREELLQALNDGKIKVQYRILNFLDQGDSGSSTRGGAAVIDMARAGNAKAFWNLQDYIFSNQAEVSRKWDNEDMSKAVAAYGVDQSIVDAVKSGDNQKKALEVFKGNSDRLSKDGGSVSSPRVFVDGQEIELTTDQATGGVASWVGDVVNS